MNRSESVKFFAQLVHRGLLDAATAQSVLGADDPVSALIDSGAVTAAQWEEWVATDAGARPKLTRYELGDLLGEGGEARVFRAEDRQTGEVVALKILRAELAKDANVVRRFVAEAKLLIELQSPHIVRGVRVAREGQTYFFAMEVVDGQNLQERLDDEGALDEDLALDVVRQAAEALAALHDRALVHRDIKPGNLMLDESGVVRLIDLGFAIAGGGGADEAETTAGTVHYIAPEQARGQSGLDVRADIYALGATLYHLLTGSLPFSGETGEEVMAKQVLEALSGEEIRSKDLSPQAHYLIEKMMAKEVEIRFQDPRDLAAEVDAVLQQRRSEQERQQDRPTLGRRRADRERSSRRRRRR